MAFWDNLGKNASETTSKAVQQARDLSETTKLSALVFEEEKKIKNLYLEIGKGYAALHRNDYDERLGQQFAALFESEEKVKSYQKRIDTLKGVRRCAKCGAQVGVNVSFCNVCGEPVPKIVEMEPTQKTSAPVCPGCGVALEKGARFCRHCGYKIGTEPGTEL